MLKEVARGLCVSVAGKKDKAFSKGTLPSLLRFVQAQKSISRWNNITQEVEGDADRFACELPHERYRKNTPEKQKKPSKNITHDKKNTLHKKHPPE